MKKRAIFLAACLMLMGLTCMGDMIMDGRSADAGDRTLVKLWKEYREAESADLPQKQLEILQKIKKSAAHRDAVYDWYRAGEEYVHVRGSVNWKDREQAESDWKEEVESCLFPIAVYTYRKDRALPVLDYLREHATEMQKDCHRDFYGSFTDDSKFGGLLPELLKCDYDYALWDLSICSWAEKDEARKALEPRVSGSYPLEAFLGYLSAAGKYDSGKALEAFAARYSGSAAALLAREELLWQRFRTLEDSSRAVSGDYKSLREDVKAFEAQRKSFSGAEARIAACCTSAVRLAETLDCRDIAAEIKDSFLTLSLRNVRQVTFELKLDGKAVLKKELENTQGSYYLRDTVTCRLDALDDGSYEALICSGKTRCEFSYERYTLSAAQKCDSKGYAVFVADYLSGEPLQRTDLRLFDWKGREIGSVRGLALNGFTYLPEELSSRLDTARHSCTLMFSQDEGGVKRLSRPLTVSTSPGSDDFSSIESLNAQILTDRGAYRPGDTLHFKAILYSGSPQAGFRTLPEGRKFKAVLKDSRAKTIAEQELTTNGFGSLASSFKLERAERNGQYSLCIDDDKKHTVGNAYFTVDDFVLPSFELIFERDDRLYLPGDEVEVKGTVRSYSLHSLGSADAVYTLRRFDEVTQEKRLTLSPDGSFAVRIATDPLDRYASYTLNIKITDGTGETLEWNRWLSVNSEIPLDIEIMDTQEGSCDGGLDIISSDRLGMLISVGEKLRREGLLITYSVFFKDKEIHRGTAENGKPVYADLTSYPSGDYKIKAEASARDASGFVKSSVCEKCFLRLKESDTVLDAPVENVFRVLPEGVGLQLGAARGPVWAVVEICGYGSRSLVSSLVHLDGVQARPGSLMTLHYDFAPDWGDAVTMYVFYFRGGRRYSYQHEFRRSESLPDALPLSFTRFLDRTLPGRPYTFTVRTDPDVECALSIFDKSTEAIRGNEWYPVRLSAPAAPSMRISSRNGVNSGDGRDAVIGYGIRPRVKSALLARSTSALEEESVMYALDDEAEASDESFAPSAANSSASDVAVRSDFAQTLAFSPLLRSDSRGEVRLDFRTSDNLSTFYVSLYAHDRKMRSSALRREMTVSLPVKVSVAEPQFLYSGDAYTLRATLSSSSEAPVEGTLRLEAFPGSDYRTLKAFASTSVRVSISPLETRQLSLPVTVPQIEQLGLKLTFTASSGSGVSDALFVCVPVLKPAQTLTESHSAVLRSAEDEQALIDTLRSQFVNFDGREADLKVTSVLDLVREALPERIQTGSNDLLTLVDAYYCSALAEKLGAPSDASVTGSLVDRILDCNNSDGGYAWFAGMRSSPVMTAVAAGRFAALERKGVQLPERLRKTLAGSIAYLDSDYHSLSRRPLWCGALSPEQYLYVRSLYASVPLRVKPSREFRKAVREYLLPPHSRGLEGRIFDKARRTYIIYRLLENDDALSLAKSLGAGIAVRSRLRKSMDADLASLRQYAVEHSSGGVYFPNAVMPWRGLLESEAYAHSLICDLLRDCGQDSLADSLRLWLMVQKETQQWDADPGYVDALSSILDGSQQVLDTKIVSLSASALKPFSDISASGNGFSIERTYSVERVCDGKKTLFPLSEGDVLKVGDRVVAEYRVWSGENRSFVRLSAPRPASLRPSDQLSGHYGWGLSPLRLENHFVFTPLCYRSVLKDRTQYWFDSFPEEKTVITEEFFVTQEGRFSQGVVEIESLYAPHYRASSSGQSPLCSSAGA